MNKQKRKRSLIALVIAFLLIAILAAILFVITLKVFPDTSYTTGLIFSIIGAAILGAIGFFSGLKDTYDLVLSFIDDFFSSSSDETLAEGTKILEKTPNSESLSGNASISNQGNIVATSVGKEASVQAENIAGRDINIFNFANPVDSTTTISILFNQIDKLGESLSTQAQQQLITLKNNWRTGKRRETLDELQRIRQDREHWAALSKETKAQYLCFEGGIQLHLTGDTHIAKELADQAHALTPTNNEARLHASIAFTEGNLNKAIEILAGSNDLDSLLVQASFYLELGEPVQCLQILESDTISSSPTAETYRLRALSYLITKEVDQAQLEIKKALELNASWESIKFSAALIDYYSTIALSGFNNPIIISAEPLGWTLIKRDDESLSKLRRAADLLQELMKLEGQTQQERNRFRIWYLACLSNHPERQDEAASYCLSLLEKEPSFTLAIRWALARGYEFDLETSETALEVYITNDKASIYQILALIDCYIANQKLDEAIELLEQKEIVFQKQGLIGAWLYAFARTQVSNDSPEAALRKIDNYEQDIQAYNARMFILHAFAQKTNDWQALNNFLNKIYVETNNPAILLDICETRSVQEDWPYIVKNSETLLNHFETAEILRLVAVATCNAEHFKLCLDFLDKYTHLFPESKLPLQLRQIHIVCQHEMGDLSQAIREAQSLASGFPTLENLMPLVNLYGIKGDFTGLAIIARKLENFPNLPPEIALMVSQQLIWEDRSVALLLWEKATSHKLSDELVSTAFTLGIQLGLESELKALSLRLQKLGQEGRGGIIHIQAHELLDMIKQDHEDGAKTDEAYRAGRGPIHFVSQEFNLSLATLYHAQLLENEKEPCFSNRHVLLARHGGRMPNEGFSTTTSDLNIHLDVTAVLLAEHLDILSKVEQAFAPLHIPAELIPALIQLRKRITPHQPTQLEEHKQIIELVNNGSITVLDEELSPEFDNDILIAEMGRDWVILAETARKAKGFLVDYLPLTKNDLSNNLQPRLPDDFDKLLINCRALVDSLLQEGPLSREEYHRALEGLGNEGQVNPSETIPQQGSFLYCDSSIPGTLAGANLLAIVCQRYKVHISNQLYERLKTSVDSSPYMQSLADWVDKLISRLNHGLDNQLYKIILISPEKRKQLKDIRSQHLLNGVLSSLLGFEPKEGDIIWADDRWLNSYHHRDGVPIADVYDILKLLVGNKQMSEAEYYQSLHKLRSGNVIFIPIQRDEIIYHLKQAQIHPIKGVVVETQQLKVLRQYAASCLLQKTIMQAPPMPPGSPNEQGETTFVINFMRAVSWVLFDIWADNSIDKKNRQVLCEWIVDNLYLDYLYLARAASLPIKEGNQIYQASLGLISILIAPIISTVGYSDDEIQSRKTYFSWLYERLLQRRFSADPKLLTSVIDALKNTFNQVKENAQQSEAKLVAMDLLLQTYYDDLPEPIQQELRNDTNFMADFGLTFIPTISINDLSFDPRQFFQAAHIAINGQQTTITPIQSDTEIVFEPVKDELALKFIDPNTSEEIRVQDERFILLLDSIIEREKMLYQRKNWFDCSDMERQEAIASIIFTEDMLQRIKIADSWRESSVYIYYGNLYNQIRTQKRIHFSTLIPPKANRLPSHYRFSLSIETNGDFLEEFAVASKTILHEEGLEIAIHRLVGFPITLSESVLNEISLLSDSELLAFIRNLLRLAGSPLSKIHLIKILVHLAEQKPAFYRLARRIAKDLFTKKSDVEFTAFSNLLRWVYQEFDHWQETSEWGSRTRLAMVWAHTHQLFSIFMATDIPPKWIAETFERNNRRLPTDLFNRDISQWFDVAHPRHLTFPVFTLMGLADSINQKEQLVFDPVLQELCTQVGFQKINDLILPASPFWMDNQRASNTLGTFMGECYSEKLVIIFGEELMSGFRNKAYESMVNQAVMSLIENPHNFSSWIPLRAVIRDFPPYDSLIERLTELLTKTNFIDLLDDELENGLAVIEFAGGQLVHLSSEELTHHLQVQFTKVVEYLAIRPQILNLQESVPDSWGLRLIEVALNISFCNQTTNGTILEFNDLLAQIVVSLPKTKSTIKSIIQILCEELPVEQGQHFGELLLRLRSE